MSWLFDRLTDLAVADRLEIVVDAQVRPALVDELQRASALPNTAVTYRVRVGSPPARTRPSRFVASGGGSAHDALTGLGEADLGVALGSPTSSASLHIGRMADLVSLVDSLVTLRSYAQRSAS